MPLQALAGAGAAIGAGVIGFAGQERTNRANAKMAREQMDFQERMSSTAVQRQVEDYRKAGLNPALAYGQGGASSPGGSIARMEDSIDRGMSSAKSTRLYQQELANAKEQQAVLESQSRKNFTDAGMIQTWGPLEARARIAASEASAEEARARTRFTNFQTDIGAYDLPGARNRARAADTLFGRAVAPFLSDALRARQLLPR